jgi:hypothetical protein
MRHQTYMFYMHYACEARRFRIVPFLNSHEVPERVCLRRDVWFGSSQNFVGITPVFSAALFWACSRITSGLCCRNFVRT